MNNSPIRVVRTDPANEAFSALALVVAICSAVVIALFHISVACILIKYYCDRLREHQQLNGERPPEGGESEDSSLTPTASL